MIVRLTPPVWVPCAWASTSDAAKPVTAQIAHTPNALLDSMTLSCGCGARQSITNATAETGRRFAEPKSWFLTDYAASGPRTCWAVGALGPIREAEGLGPMSR